MDIQGCNHRGDRCDPPKFSDTLTLSPPGGGQILPTIAEVAPKNFPWIVVKKGHPKKVVTSGKGQQFRKNR